MSDGRLSGPEEDPQWSPHLRSKIYGPTAYRFSGFFFEWHIATNPQKPILKGKGETD